MANKRIFYAVYAVGIAKESSTSYIEIHGLQTVSLTTTFNLDRVSEIGQLEIYQNIENVPDVELTLEKVIDGYPPIYILATRGRTNTSLQGRQNPKCEVAMSIFDETYHSAASGVNPLSEVTLSGMFVSSLTYTFPVDGNFTESVTLVGANKTWRTSNFVFKGSSSFNVDTPLAYTSGVGGVQRRQNLVFTSQGATSLTGTNYTILPGGTQGIPGISSSGTNDKTADVFGAHVQNITVSTNLGRTPIFELGRRIYYHRYVEFPTEVTCEIQVLDIEGDKVGATEAGILGNGENVNDKQIKIVVQEGLVLDLGSKNKLQSVSWTGAGADGGNATTTYSYRNFNSLAVSHPQDPN